VYHARELVSSTQGFWGGHLGVWAQEVSHELNSNVGQPRKGNKDKKRYFICGDIILEIKDKKRYFICCDIILEIKDKEIFYLL